MEYSSLFLLCVIPSIMLYGIAKSGLGGSLSLISIPLMTIVMPLSQALAIILPILILSDIVAVYKFRKQFDLDTVKLMTIGGGIGVAIGSLTYTYFSEALIKFLIGLMGFLFTTHYFIFKRFKDTKTGAVDIAVDPNNPRILFAAMWEAYRSPWEMSSASSLQYQPLSELSPSPPPLRSASRRTGALPPPKSAGLPGVTRQRVGLLVKIFD